LLRAASDPASAQAVAARAQALYEREYSRPVYERKIKKLLEMVS
jgi:hypothetical protein